MVYDSKTLEWLFRTVNRMHFNCVKEEFEKKGVNKDSHQPLLFTLHYQMGNKIITQKELSYLLGIKPSILAVSIKRMEKAGLIQKVPDEDDLRCNIIRFTEKGKKLLDKSTSIFNDIDRKMCVGFTDKEKTQLKQFYIRIIQNLEKAGTHDRTN